MKIEEILAHCDHTQLSPAATWSDIRTLCDEGIAFHTASVCIPPCYVKQAKAYMGGALPVCTVVGFPNGYMTTAVKLAEAEEALACGADEIDMVINIGALKAGNTDYVFREIKALKRACGHRILKVILETCLLTEAEKITMCRLVTEGGADFIKTSTGFSKGGATLEDVRLFKQYIGANVKMKAAGGISSLADAEEFLALGCERLGTSRIVKLAKEGK